MCAASEMDENGQFVLILCTLHCLDDDLTITLLVDGVRGQFLGQIKQKGVNWTDLEESLLSLKWLKLVGLF